MLPTFLVIGAMKAGTTSLWAYLDAHPQIYMSRVKEVDFFSDNGNWERGVEWYEQHFTDAGAARAIGEASPHYTLPRVSQDTPARIASVLPDVRLVYIVRNPIDRIVSHYRQGVADWNVTEPIDEIVRSRAGVYVGASRYMRQINRYLEHVPRERLHVLTTESLNADRNGELTRLYSFVGVDAAAAPPVTELGEQNRGADRRQVEGAARTLRRSGVYERLKPMVPKALRSRGWRALSKPAAVPAGADVLSPETRAWIVSELSADVMGLRSVLGESFDCWGLVD